jgi:phosphatidylserine/phosphatidylglycerophosphate/cardiolipin synthase-like enzyme
MPKNSPQKPKWIWSLLVFVVIVLTAIYYGPDTFSTQTADITATQGVKGESTEVPTKVIATSTGFDVFEVYFTNPDDPSAPKIEKYLIEKIDASQKTIDVAIFEFSLEDVAQALIRAKDRGVDVRIVYDNEFADPDPQITEVKSAGIPVTPDNRQAYMHNKFFVFDSACVWTGSFNISDNAANKNNEDAIYFCSPEAAENYGTEFSEMFAGEYGPSSPANTPYSTFTVDGVLVENYFAPEDQVMTHVIDIVSKARTSVHFMAFSFTDDNLGNTMVSLADRGVIVEGIFETTGADTQYSECGKLLKNGEDVRLDGNSATFHHKVIIVDNSIVILGSFNFSSNANTQNDENLLIIHDPVLATAFEQQYQLMKSEAVKPSGDTCKK